MFLTCCSGVWDLNTSLAWKTQNSFIQHPEITTARHAASLCISVAVKKSISLQRSQARMMHWSSCSAKDGVAKKSLWWLVWHLMAWRCWHYCRNWSPLWVVVARLSSNSWSCRETELMQSRVHSTPGESLPRCLASELLAHVGIVSSQHSTKFS